MFGVNCIIIILFFIRVYEISLGSGERLAGKKAEKWIYYIKNKKRKHNLFFQNDVIGMDA